MPTDSPDGLKTPPEELVALPPAAASAATRADSPPGLKDPPEELVANYYQEKEDRASAEKLQKEEELCTKVLGCPSQRPNVNPPKPKQQGVSLPAAASTASTAGGHGSNAKRPSKLPPPQPNTHRVMLPAAASAASAAGVPGSPANRPRSNRPPPVVSPPSHQPTAKAEKKKMHQAMLHSMANNGTELFGSLFADNSSGWAADFETHPDFVMIYTHTTVETHLTKRAMDPDPVTSTLENSMPPDKDLLGIPNPSGNGDDRNISPRSKNVTFSLPTSLHAGNKKEPEDHQKTELDPNRIEREVKRKLFHKCNDSCVKKKALPCVKLHPSSSSDDDTDDDGADDDHPTAAAIGGADAGGGGEVSLFNGEESAEAHEEEPPPLVKRSSLHREDDEDDSMEEEVEDDEMEEEVDDGSEDEDGTEDDEMKEEKEAEDASSSNSSFISHDESFATSEDASYAPPSPSSSGTDLDSTYSDVAESVDELLEDQKENERVHRDTPRCKSENGVARYSPSDEEALLSDDYPEEQHDQVGGDGMRQLTIPELYPRYEVRQSHSHPAPPAAARTQRNAHASDASPPSAATAVAARGRKPDSPPTSNGKAAAVRMYAKKKKAVEAAKDYTATSFKVKREVEVIDLTGAPARPRGARQEVEFIDLTLDDSSEDSSSSSSSADSESNSSGAGDSSSTNQDGDDEQQEVEFIDLTLDDSSEDSSSSSSGADSESNSSGGGDSSSTNQDGDDEH